MTEYVGIPYKLGGRSRADGGLDCYGLVRLILKEEFEKSLPVLSEVCEKGPGCGSAEAITEGRPLIDARPVDSPEDGDIVAMKIRGALSHLGVYWHGWVVHTLSGHDSVLERIDGLRLRGRIEGFYRV